MQANLQPTNHGLKKVVLSLIPLALLLSGVFFVSAQGSENNINVSVNISEKTIIDIQPKEFAYGQGSTLVEPGTVAGPSQEQSGYGRIQVENLGSVNITQIWFNASYPSQRPFGTGTATYYDSANFIALNRSGGSAPNQFINRVEYGLDQPAAQDIIYLDTNSNWDYGRFRNTSREYFWAVDDESGSDLGGNTFRIGQVPHTSDQTGTTDLQGAVGSTCDGGDNPGGSNACNSYTLQQAGSTDWYVTEVEIGVQDSGAGIQAGGQVYCAAMNNTKVHGVNSDPPVHFIKWNKGHPAVQNGGADCSWATNYTVGDSAGDSLDPGAWEIMNVRARVPYGVVSAQLPKGNVFVLANSG